MIDAKEVLYIQASIATRRQTAVGLRDSEAFAKSLFKPNATKNGLPAYPSLFAKLGALVETMVRQKPFQSQNRAVALIIVILVLHRNGYRFTTPAQDLDNFFNVIEIGFHRWQRIMRWIREGAARR